MALRVIDRAIQAHGAAGVSDDISLAAAWAHTRTIRLADGPDEVHREAIAKLELKQVRGRRAEAEDAEAQRRERRRERCGADATTAVDRSASTVALVAADRDRARAPAAFTVVEATIADMRAAMERGARDVARRS